MRTLSSPGAPTTSPSTGTGAIARRSPWREAGSIACVVLVLLAQNVLYFWRHYTGGHAFPWDFTASYHAAPYYWIEAARHGIPTGWVPFQGMGYPLHLNLQSGFYYPPLWAWVALDRPFSIEAAAFLQGVHVAFGAIGAAVAARLMGRRWSACLLAGVFYQSFGGLYSNSQHPDIVRGYALLPWLVALVLARGSPPSRLFVPVLLLTPFLVYLQWTGAYVGQTIAVLFVVGITLVVRTAVEPGWRRSGMAVLAAMAAGSLAAGIYFVPPALDVGEFVRASDYMQVRAHYLQARDVFALVYAVDRPFFTHDISMRSLFVGIPVLALLLVGLPHWRQWNPWAALVAVLAGAMASGVLHAPLVQVLPPLGYSRFPIADYRGFLGLVLVLFAVGVADRLDEQRQGILWVIALLSFVLVGNHLLGLDGPEWRDAAGAIFAVLAGTVLVLTVVRRRFPTFVVPLLVLLTVVDWTRTQRDQAYFNLPGARWEIEREIGPLDAARPLLLARARGEDGCRPARIDIPETQALLKPWRGYLSGFYMTEDYSGAKKLRRQRAVLADPGAHAFAVQPWKAVAGDPTAPAAALADAAPVPVRCVRYAAQWIEYAVELAAPTFAVENELYSNGWTATVVGRGGDKVAVLRPEEVHGFRGWRLPAGRYTLVAEYVPPHRAAGLAVTLTGVAAWIVLALLLLAGRRRRGTAAAVP